MHSLSIAQVQRIFVRSFLLSQGSARLQSLLFAYVARTHPAWRIAEEDVSQVKAGAARACHQFLTVGWHEPGDHKVNQEIDTQWSHLVKWLNAPQDARVEDGQQPLLTDIIVEMIARDYLYLVVKRGRPRQDQEEGDERRKHTPRGRFFSHFCQYGLLRKPTGLAVFDALFTEIRAACEGPWPAMQHILAQEYVYPHVVAILECHNRHYPEQLLAIPREKGALR